MNDRDYSQTRSADLASQALDGVPDYLDLSGSTTLKVTQVEHMIAVRAAYCITPATCPHGHVGMLESEKIDDWLVWDAPRFGIYPTLIQIFVPVFRCLECGCRFQVQPPWLDYRSVAAEDDKRPARPTRTSRLTTYIMDRMTTMTTFAQIARDTGYSEDAIRAVFERHFNVWDAERGKNLPKSFEMDETLHKYGKEGGFVTLLVGKDGCTTDVLPDRENSTIARRFFAAENRDEVEYVGMDFCEPFRDVATQPLKPQREMPAEEEIPELLKGVEMVEYFIEDSGASSESTRALPGAHACGDNFHLSKVMEEGLTKVRNFVANSLFEKYLAEELAKASPEDIARMGEALSKRERKPRLIKEQPKESQTLRKGVVGCPRG